MLPKVIEDLIYFYLGRFEVGSNLPSLKVIRRLVKKSNHDIAKRYIGELYPEHTISTGNVINLRSVFQQPQTIICFYNALVMSTNICRQTSVLRWLLKNELASEPVYMKELLKSYLIRIIHDVHP